ncbi:LysR family transcriptional regulator [Parahaliea mediterranea]|uniref:LysR family transcriptional regulator n=1 Tax=Parahaliea mediterranea TaxID=651086 RepID=A0A939DEV6_9GAMM|nr:LysR family transcriptional regulator [Parahaliea mediterranea]MBN7796779.1 LysR family transcriptional regulator [Parahaliea mediterranea]
MSTRQTIETRQLQHVATLARCGNFHRAAEALFITQPALTKSIRKLEQQLGVALFDRDPDLVRPTEHCLVLLEHGRRIFDELDQVGNRLAELSAQPLSRVMVGCGPIIGGWGLQEAITQMHAAYPAVRFSIQFGNAADLAQQLRARQLHVMVADTEALEGDLDVDIAPLPTEEFVFTCRTGHPLARAGVVESPDLLHYKMALPGLVPRAKPWLGQFMPEGWHIDAFVDQIVGVTSDNYHLLLDLLVTTDYLSIGPRSVFQRLFDQGRLMPLASEAADAIASRPGIVRLRGRTLPEAITTFCDALQDTAERLVTGS